MLIATGAVADERRIEYQIPTGFTFEFQELSAMESDVTISGGGQQMPVQQVLQSNVKGTAKVLESTAGKPTLVELRFDGQSATQTTINGQAQPAPFSLAGQTLRVQVQNNEVASVMGSSGPLTLDPSVLGAVETWAVFHDDLLPNEPVEVGDAWRGTIMASGGTMQNDMTYTVRDFALSDGFTVANLDWQGTVSSDVPESRMTGEISGLAVL
ncbi:MAG: hypothetical protein AAFX40_16505, partial [Cyanobacteria bacterium J06639_1]